MVIMFDTYERLGQLDEWVRTWLVPRLPATALTVLAGRAAPDSAWRADPAWRELLRVVSLRNLSPDDSRQYLHACGVDTAPSRRVGGAGPWPPAGAVTTGRCGRSWRRGDRRSTDPRPCGYAAPALRRDRSEWAASPCSRDVLTRKSDHRDVVAGGARAGRCTRALRLATRACLCGLGAGRCLPARLGSRRPGGGSSLAGPRRLPAASPRAP